MDKRIVFLKNRLATARDKHRENEQLWYRLYLAAHPELPPNTPINGLESEEVYNHARENVSMELLFIQLEIELVKMGGYSDV